MEHEEVQKRNAEIYKLAHDLNELEILEAKVEYARKKYDKIKNAEYWAHRETEKKGHSHF